MNVIHLVSNKVWGGGERYALDLCKTLRSDGHNVEVYTRRKKPISDVFEREGLLKGFLPLGGELDFVSPICLASRLNKMDGKVIVHVHNFKDAATAIKARRLCRNPHQVKVVVTRHLVKAAKTGAIARKNLAELDALIFVSRLAKDTFLSAIPGSDSPKIHVVHNSIIANPTPHRHGTEPTVNIIFAGRIVPEKGLDVLIDALSLIADRDWRLTVCGTGTGRDVMPLISQARQNGIDSHIDWRGHVDNIADEMSNADIAVCPSIAPESFGLTIIEAFSKGIPAVATNNGAQPEIITDGTDGLLVPPSDSHALADALAKLIDNAQMRINMGENALRTFSSRFSYPKFYNKILSIYNEI